MKKIMKCQVFIFCIVAIGLIALKNVYAGKEKETTTTETASQIEESTTEVIPKETLPKEVRKFVKKNMVMKSATLVSRTSIKLRWKKISDADGYILYRKVKGEGFKKVKKIKKPTKKTFTDKKLTYGTTYWYTVKAYKKFEGKTYYSKYNKKGTKKKLKVKKVNDKNGYTFLYDYNGNKIKNVLAFLENPQYRIKVNLTQNVVTVYAKNGKKGYTIPVKAFLCAGNIYDTTGTFSLGVKYRFRALYYNCYSQWASRIHDDILFHTSPYTRSQDPNSLDVKEYNKLGTSASHGCIRLQCYASKWINDNCPSGTKVVIYKSDNPGALGKPKLEKLEKWHTWDPTDPTMQSKCKEAGCKHKAYK